MSVNERGNHYPVVFYFYSERLLRHSGVTHTHSHTHKQEKYGIYDAAGYVTTSKVLPGDILDIIS